MSGLGRLGEAPIGRLIERDLDDGYDSFDQLCRTAYDELIPEWPLAIVPWDQIIAARSREAVVDRMAAIGEPCGGALGRAVALAPS